MNETPKPRFKKINTAETVEAASAWGGTTIVRPAASYEVRITGTLVGTVHKTQDGMTWVGNYNDGEPAYNGWTRISTAWMLVNS